MISLLTNSSNTAHAEQRIIIELKPLKTRVFKKQLPPGREKEMFAEEPSKQQLRLWKPNYFFFGDVLRMADILSNYFFSLEDFGLCDAYIKKKMQKKFFWGKNS